MISMPICRTSEWRHVWRHFRDDVTRAWRDTSKVTVSMTSVAWFSVAPQRPLNMEELLQLDSTQKLIHLSKRISPLNIHLYKLFKKTRTMVLMRAWLTFLYKNWYCCSTQGGLFFCFMNRIVIWPIVLCGIALILVRDHNFEEMIR